VTAPHNVEAERRVLGTLLAFYTPDALTAVQATGLKAWDFYWEQHRVVYETIVAVGERDGYADVLTVHRHLASDEDMMVWLEGLVSYADANGYLAGARIVHEDGTWRRWLDATLDAVDAIHERDEDAFWNAVGRLRADQPAGALKVIDGDRAA
jgi:replicative DNA helicase